MNTSLCAPNLFNRPLYSYSGNSQATALPTEIYIVSPWVLTQRWISFLCPQNWSLGPFSPGRGSWPQCIDSDWSGLVGMEGRVHVWLDPSITTSSSWLRCRPAQSLPTGPCTVCKSREFKIYTYLKIENEWVARAIHGAFSTACLILVMVHNDILIYNHMCVILSSIKDSGGKQVYWLFLNTQHDLPGTLKLILL